VNSLPQDFFIRPGVDILQGDPDYATVSGLSKEELRRRWTSSEGAAILVTWITNNFDRQVLDSLVGKFYGRTDLRGVPLTRLRISNVDLSSVDFYGAVLEGTIFNYVNFTNSYFSESNIKDTFFLWTQMDGVLIDNADFNDKTSFLGVTLNAVNFNLAVLLQDLTVNKQRLNILKNKNPILAKVLEIVSDYGRSFSRFLICCLIIILIFALIYTFVPGTLSKTGFWNSLYFSTLTFATINYDIYPLSVVGKILVLAEAGIGYLMTGLLVAILIKKTIGN